MLKAEVSIPVGLATAATVYGIYGAALPDLATARTSGVDDDDLRAAENIAAWSAAAAVGAISLLSRDTTPFILGCGMIVILSWAHRHSRLVDPGTGRITLDSARRFVTLDTEVTPG